MDKFGMYKKIPGTGESGSYKNDTPVLPTQTQSGSADKTAPAVFFPSAQSYSYEPAETKAAPGAREKKPDAAPLSPKEVGNIIGASQSNSAQSNYNQKTNGNTVFTEKKTSHALKVFLEGQARHERLSKEIDLKYKGGDKK